MVNTKLEITFVVPGIDVTKENHLCLQYIKLCVVCNQLIGNLLKTILTCIEVEVKKPRSKIIGKADVYLVQYAAISSNSLKCLKLPFYVPVSLFKTRYFLAGSLRPKSYKNEIDK